MYRRKLFLLISILGIVLGLFFVFKFYQTFFWSNTQFENDFSYVFVDRDDTIDSLILQMKPLLKSTKNFLIAAEKKGYAQRVRSGKYRIQKSMGNNDIINILRSERLTTKVVFNNQERIEDLAGRIAEQIEADSLSLLNSFLDPVFLEEAGFTEDNALAMYLPNTYEVFWDTTPENFRNRMLKYYQSYWNENRKNKVKSLGLTPVEAVILASIVQKESVQVEEQNTIAGVYLNRLKKKMKLQADPTVIYAMKKATGDFQQVIKRVLYKDLKLNSPYNTYKVKGLPPGPITMPDLRTLEAVLHPEQHNYLYFVAAPEKIGYHLFASSLAEHNRNKKKYTSWLNNQKIYR
ncbi:MAG: endolytic transglycosylase MltG [Flavobacteriaceae bacterium]